MTRKEGADEVGFFLCLVIVGAGALVAVLWQSLVMGGLLSTIGAVGAYICSRQARSQPDAE